MKKNLSLAGFSVVAMGLLMGSCVSKRKYMDAQTKAAQQYSTDSAQWASRTNTMQQNITSLEQKSADYQKQMDSFRTTSETYQKRWEGVQSAYTTQNTSTEQLHQQIHTAIDQYVEASNVEARNGKVYVNLPEKMLFASGSSALSAKGKQALDKLAEVLSSNQDVEVDIIATAAYYNSGTETTGMTSDRSNENMNTTDRTSNMNVTDKTKDNASSKDTGTAATARSNNNRNADSDTDNKTADSATANQTARANIGDSAYPGSGTKTARTAKQDPNKKTQPTAKARTSQKTSTATAKKSSQGDRSVSFKSAPKSKTKAVVSKAPSWNLNVARSTAIVRELTQQGLPQARIVLTSQNGKGVTTNEWASTNKGYQVVISPKMDTYYQMMQEGQQGQGSTSKK